jgi:hypothetical protein
MGVRCQVRRTEGAEPDVLGLLTRPFEVSTYERTLLAVCEDSVEAYAKWREFEEMHPATYKRTLGDAQDGLSYQGETDADRFEHEQATVRAKLEWLGYLP